MVIGPGSVNLSRRRVWARDLRLYRTLAPQWSGHGRHFCLVTVIADSHGHAPGKIHPLDLFEKAVNEVLPRLLAIGHDVDPGVFLLFQRQQGRVPLRLQELLTFQLPRRPQHLRLG
jgi:hypothetical protein